MSIGKKCQSLRLKKLTNSKRLTDRRSSTKDIIWSLYVEVTNNYVLGNHDVTYTTGKTAKI